jgi:two-component system OmpR family response regulator
MRILLIEDDPVQAQVVRQVLESEGFTVDHLDHGEDGVVAAEAVGYAAVILDLGLPDIDGIEVLQRLRAAQLRIPVMILTTRAAVAERIDGLDSGADDYLPKPFEIDELVARLRALLRRPPPDVTLVCDNLRLSPQRQEASVGDTPLALPRLQLLMLELMMRRPGRPVSKALIDSVLYDNDPADTTARIHFHVSQLRKRLRAAGARVRIETFPDLGYALMVDSLTPSVPAR